MLVFICSNFDISIRFFCDTNNIMVFKEMKYMLQHFGTFHDLFYFTLSFSLFRFFFVRLVLFINKLKRYFIWYICYTNMLVYIPTFLGVIQVLTNIRQKCNESGHTIGDNLFWSYLFMTGDLHFQNSFKRHIIWELTISKSNCLYVLTCI